MLATTAGCTGLFDGEDSSDEHPAAIYADMIPSRYPTFQLFRASILEQIPIVTLPEYLSIDWEDLAYRVSGASVRIYDGQFQLTAVGDGLQQHRFEEGEYGGYDVYERSEQSVAIVDGTIITGEGGRVRACIDTVDGDEESYYQRDPVPKLIDEFDHDDAADITLSPIEPFEGEIANASSIEGFDDQSMQGDIQELHLFEEGDAASAAVEAVEGHYEALLEGQEYDDMQVNRRDEIVEVIVENASQLS